ncbi:hypothetical protein BCR44DRAFT_1423918, partial [Catenaria anguillulae PL171]
LLILIIAILVLLLFRFVLLHLFSHFDVVRLEDKRLFHPRLNDVILDDGRVIQPHRWSWRFDEMARRACCHNRL